MNDRDELTAAFDALRAEVMPTVRRPGVGAARQTVRARRTRRRPGGVAGAAVLAVAAFGLPGMHGDKPKPEETPTPSPSVSTPAPDGSTSASPVPGPAVQPGATGSRQQDQPPLGLCGNGAYLFE